MVVCVCRDIDSRTQFFWFIPVIIKEKRRDNNLSRDVGSQQGGIKEIRKNDGRDLVSLQDVVLDAANTTSNKFTEI